MPNRKSVVCEIPHLGQGMGHVSITYSADIDGLWVLVQMGYKRSFPGTQGREPVSYCWNVSEPTPELLMTAVSCGLGIMPPWAFADWLEENADTIRPLVTKFEEGTPPDEMWMRVLYELRRFANPEPEPTHPQHSDTINLRHLVSTESPNTRTVAQVLTQRRKIRGGCCNRYADQMACDCLTTAADYNLNNIPLYFSPTRNFGLPVSIEEARAAMELPTPEELE